jgi:hypothetical protein
LDHTSFETCTIPPGRLREECSITDSSRIRNKVRRLLCGQRQDESVHTNQLSYLIDPTCEKKRREIERGSPMVIQGPMICTRKHMLALLLHMFTLLLPTYGQDKS